MGYSEMFGPYCDDLAEGTILEDLHASYQEVLAADGIAFPTEELKKLDRQWNAYAAELRGAAVLNEDGSPVDISDFNPAAARKLLAANQPAFGNAKRLESLVRLGLLSKAGSLAIQETTTMYGNSDGAQVSTVVGNFKHFVQTGMAVEEWARPWQEIVANGFEGHPLQFPLSAPEIRYAGALLISDTFKDLRDTHFPEITLIQHNIFLALSGSRTCDPAKHEERQLASLTGLFLRTSPGGTNELIDDFVISAHLLGDIDWQREIAAAVEHVGRRFEG